MPTADNMAGVIANTSKMENRAVIQFIKECWWWTVKISVEVNSEGLGSNISASTTANAWSSAVRSRACCCDISIHRKDGYRNTEWPSPDLVFAS